MSGKQIYYQYKKEKWQIKIKKKYKDFSPEVRKYLIEEKVSNIPFLFECLTDYCFQPDDEDEKKEFAESVDYLYKKYHTFIKAVKFLQKENKEIERFLISAFGMFEDEDGNSTYPGPEACYKYILELSELIDDYEKNLYEAVAIEPDGLSIQGKTLSESIKEMLEDVIHEHEKNTAPDKAETPEYIQNLIEKKLLYPDGKRVLGSLDALIDALGPQPAQFIQETFLKANGKPYTLKHIQDVMAGRKLAD